MGLIGHSVAHGPDPVVSSWMDQPEAGTSSPRAGPGDSDTRATGPYGRTVSAEQFSAAGVEPLATPPAGADWPRLNGINVTRRLRRGGTSSADGDARFQVESLLGVGATGEVYSVLDRNLRRQVAIKVLNRELIDDHDQVTGFVDEARITASLQHPNVLPVHEIDVTEEGQPYFSMSRIEGCSLGSVIAQSSPGARHAKIATANSVVSTILAVCHAISYAHHQKLVHQDIKPDNIMLGDFGEVLVLDWGSAVRMDADGKVRTRIYGTPLYMSPEQARREHSDATSDIYCIGATLFHALTLRLPIWSDDSEAFWNMKRRGDIAPPDEAERAAMPAELLEIALKAMAPVSGDRYPALEAMLRDLERFQAGLAVSVHRDSLWRRFRRWHRRNAKVFWISAAAASLVAAAAGVVAIDKIKELTVWRPVCIEDFSRPAEALAEHWVGRYRTDNSNMTFFDAPLTDGDFFTVHDGALHVATDKPVPKLGNRKPIVDVAYVPGLRGNIRVEWDYSSELNNRNFNCFMAGRNREDGFTFHVGGFGDPSSVVLTKGNNYIHLVHDICPSPLAVGRVYRFAMEHEDRHVRLFIDGHRVVDYIDAEDFGSAIEQSFGFDSYSDSRLVIDNVKVYHQSLAQRISPIQVGDRFFQLQQYEEAERQYAEIAASYPGTSLRPQALFKLGICASRRNHREDAERKLADFEKEYQGHELVPFSMYERLALARAGKSEEAVARIRSGLIAFKGHPILRQVLIEIGQEQLPMLRATPAVVFGDLPYPEDIVRRIEEEYAVLERWAKDYGTSLDKNPFTSSAPEVLERYGDYAFIFAHCAEQESIVARALMRMGRFEEVIRRFPKDSGHRAQALNNLGRFDEALALPGLPTGDLEWTLFLSGDIARLEAEQPSAWALNRMKSRAGRGSEVLAVVQSPSNEFEFGYTQRAEALIALGRADEVLRDYHHPAAHARALVALKRYEEAIVANPADTVACPMAGLGIFIDGNAQRWREIQAVLDRLQPNLDDDDVEFSGYLMAPVLRAISGEAVDPRQAYARVLRDMKETFCQRLWHTAAYIAGDIDEQRFREQPNRTSLDTRLLLARALRAELHGDRAQALECYTAYSALPPWKRSCSDCEEMFRAWRLQALAVQAAR